MKSLSIFLLITLVVCSDIRAWSAGEPFAVVELFASEGCSSCPPADRFLQELTKVARSQNKRIFPLSFQVDYWNYLGWKDPYSSPQYTERQREYAQTLRLSSIFTPQMIINGTKSLVGSNRAEAQNLIDQALRVPSAETMDVTVQIKETQILIDYNLEKIIPDTVLNVALVEGGLVSRPSVGENAGATLEHENVVRAFKTISVVDKEGTIALPKPDIDPIKSSVILYLQSKNDRRILAAEMVQL